MELRETSSGSESSTSLSDGIQFYTSSNDGASEDEASDSSNTVHALLGTYRRIPSFTHKESLKWSLVFGVFNLCCALFFAKGERNKIGTDRRFARGCVVALYSMIIMGFDFSINSPTLVLGVKFDPRFLCSFLVPLPIGLAAASVSINGYRLAILPLVITTLTGSFIASILLFNVPNYHSEAHKKLDLGIGPPLFAIFIVWVLSRLVYLDMLSTLEPSSFWTPVVGAYPALSVSVVRYFCLVLITKSFKEDYIEPRERRLQWERSQQENHDECCSVEQHGETPEPPEIRGDVERIHGHMISFCTCSLENYSMVLTVAGVFRYPESMAWKTSICLSMLSEFTERVGLQQRGFVRMFKWLRMPGMVDMFRFNSLNVAYMRNRGGPEYLGFSLLISFSICRAVIRGHARCLFFLDMEPIVPKVILIWFCSQVVVDILVRLCDRCGVVRFLATRYPAHHPLGDQGLRKLDVWGFIWTFGSNTTALVVPLCESVGVRFLTGICQTLNADDQFLFLNHFDGCS